MIVLEPAIAVTAAACPVKPIDWNNVIAEHHARTAHQLVIGDCDGAHRILIRSSDLSIPLALVLPVDDGLPLRVDAAARFDRLLRHVRTGRSLRCHPTANQRGRLMLLLQMLDAHHGHATLRAIAFRLIYRNRSMPSSAEWKGSNERRRAMRLMQRARELSQTGFKLLLRGQFRQPPKG